VRNVSLFLINILILVWAGVYLLFISVFALSVFFFTLSPDFHVPKRRRLRGTLFLSLGISTAIPILHLTSFTILVLWRCFLCFWRINVCSENT